jgi:hypothetical protein
MHFVATRTSLTYTSLLLRLGELPLPDCLHQRPQLLPLVLGRTQHPLRVRILQDLVEFWE